jgi:para-nitrobenzyl esterase
MLGTTADEATFFFRAAGRRIDPDERGLEAMVARLLPGGDPRARIAADRARAGANGAPTDPNSVLVRIATAAMFADPAERWSLARAAAGGRVYRCRTDHPSPEQGLGAVHTITVPLLFGTFRDGGVAAAVAGTGPGAERASRALVEATAGFLRDGNPGWPPVPATGPAAVTVFGGE